MLEGSENLFDAEVAAHRKQSIVCRETIAEVGLDPKPLTRLGGSEKTKGDADYSIADSEEITDIVEKNFMTGPFIDIQHSGHAASGSMTGRAGKMSEKQPQPSRTVRKRGSPGMGLR